MTKYDLTGKKFGKLTVISYAGLDNTKKNSKWNCNCECGKKTVVGRPCLVQGHTQSCGCICSPPKEEYEIEREKRFFKFVEKTDSCWIWKGAKDKEGYGIFNNRTKKVKAHRYAYSLFKKEKINSGYFICHACDNPSCVNPDHLYEGTHTDNMKDLKDRKRWGPPRKRYSDLQKRTIELLKTNGFSTREIASLLKISHTNI